MQHATEGMLGPYRVLDLTDERGMLCAKMPPSTWASALMLQQCRATRRNSRFVREARRLYASGHTSWHCIDVGGLEADDTDTAHEFICLSK